MVALKDMALEDLAGAINLYPWFAGARLELCRRMWEMGADTWGEEEYSAQALYLPDRSAILRLRREPASYTDSEIEPPVTVEEPQVYVVGGDYFSRAQYEKVKQSSDNVFSRMAVKIREEKAFEEARKEPEPEDFATETLAKIYADQDRPEEARRIYSRLILEFPEKSAYFASLIEKLDNKQ